MHNRKKSSQPLSEAETSAIKKKGQTYQSLIDIIFERRRKDDKSKETFDLVGKLLKMNPDFYTLWNFRKEILINNCPSLTESIKLTGIENNAVRDEELNLSTEGIKKNPKSYCAWHHRVWVAHHFEMNYENELSLCQEFLKEDQRNFHCWNYRRFLIRYGEFSPQYELHFTEKKIQENFSNYSAFHQRSVFLSASTKPLEDLVQNELAFVENAVFTEPDDQSAWWYHQFILSYAFTEVSNLVNSGNEGMQLYLTWYLEMLNQQLELMKGLLEIEENCRWVMTCLVMILQRRIQLSSSSPGRDTCNAQEDATLLNEYLDRLCDVDPLHINRYTHLRVK